MHDNWLVALALLTSGIGIACMLFALMLMELPLSGIGEVRAAADGEPLQVRGIVAAVQQREGMAVITIEQETTLDVIIFGNASEVEEGACVIVRGKRSTHKGEAQIAGTRIARCKDERKG